MQAVNHIRRGSNSKTGALNRWAMVQVHHVAAVQAALQLDGHHGMHVSLPQTK